MLANFFIPHNIKTFLGLSKEMTACLLPLCRSLSRAEVFTSSLSLALHSVPVFIILHLSPSLSLPHLSVPLLLFLQCSNLIIINLFFAFDNRKQPKILELISSPFPPFTLLNNTNGNPSKPSGKQSLQTVLLN